MTRKVYAQYCEVQATGCLSASMILSRKALGVLLVVFTIHMYGLRPRDQELDPSYTEDISFLPALVSGS